MAWRKKNFRETRALQDLPKVHEPPPDYPKLFFTPMPLKTDSKYELMVKMKQEIRNWSQISCYYLDDDSSKKDIDRYSDKYIQRNKPKFIPDYSLLPEDLRKRKSKKISQPTKKQKTSNDLDQIISKHIDTEENEVSKEDDEVEKRKKSEDDHEEEDGDEEEEEAEEDGPLEEDADYLDNYFDNGENEAYDSAGSNDEPVF